MPDHRTAHRTAHRERKADELAIALRKHCRPGQRVTVHSLCSKGLLRPGRESYISVDILARRGVLVYAYVETECRHIHRYAYTYRG